MKYSLIPDNADFALEVLNAIAELQYLNSVNVNAPLFQDWGGIKGSVRYAYQQGGTPKSAIFNVLDYTLIIMSGANNPQQFVQLFTGSRDNLVNSTPFQANPAVADAGQFLVKAWGLDSSPMTNRWLVAGFSFGGAIAEYLCAFLNGLYGPGSAECLAIASPRPGLQALSDACGNVGIRWMNAFDAVPYFPPHGEESVGFPYFAWTRLQNNLWNLYVHPFQGISMFPAGNVVHQPLPAGSDPTAASRLLSWLTSSDAQQVAQHAISTYQGLLRAVVARGLIPASVSTPVLTVDPSPFKGPLIGPNVQSSTWVPPPLQSHTQSLSNVPGTNPQKDVQGQKPITTIGGIKQVSAYIPPNYRWKSVKVAPGLYVVQWMNFTLTKPGAKSNAHAVAKWGNKMLRTLGTAPGVVQSGISQAFTAFLATATNATLGFNPPWNVL